MQDDEVKALAERIMNFEIENPFRKITDPPQKVKLSRALTQKEAEALARVALEYVEERERERTNPSATNETKLYRRIKCGSCGEYVFREEQP